MIIKSVLRNKVVFYLSSRYITYAVQFITSLVIAAELGPYYMGIWGFILLILQYFQQLHFGITNSFNVLYVHHRQNQQECNNYIGNSLALVSYLSLFVFGFYLYYILFGISEFEKYNTSQYILWICLIAILQYYVQFFTNLFRVKNQLNRVTFCQSIIVFLTFICVFVFEGEQLIISLIASYLVGNLLCFLIAVTSGSIPRFNLVQFKISYQKEILKKGLFLFLYNSCFYFIIISVRTIISGYYTVEEFGLFTFSFTLAQAILLILDSLSFIIFPKVIGKLSSGDNRVAESTISLLRLLYITSAHFLIYIALLAFPVFLVFLPKYSDALTSLNMIALTVLMGTSTYGYLELLISRNKEKKAASLSAFALIVNCLLSLFLVLIIRVHYDFVIVATMITYAMFAVLVLKESGQLLGKRSIGSVLKEMMPIKLLIPYVVAFILSLMQMQSLLFVPLLLFCVLNLKTFGTIVDAVKKLLNDPEIVDLK